MYQRLKRFSFSNNNDSDGSDDSDNLEEIKIDKCNDDNNDDNRKNNDDNRKNNEKNLKNKISNIFNFIIGGGLKTSIFTGLSNSWFMTCCIGIFTRHYIVYKLSNKKPEDYNNMVKNITMKISTKNIFFTKIFQAFANNNNLVDKELFNYFITYTDNVKYDTHEIDYDGLYDLINIATKNGDELILNSDIPIKSGNIALVYTGKLNGKNIVIKYRRNNITEKFNKSMNELKLLVNISKKIPYLCDLNINDLFEENLEIMTNQLNFLNEVNNIEIFYEKFKDVNTICVPNVYKYFTEHNPCAIIMDKLEGKRIENILHEDKFEYSKILSRFNLKCVFYDAIYHADLHSGNVIFMKEMCLRGDNPNNPNNPNNPDSKELIPTMKIGILDYGIIGTMTREEQNIFFLFFKTLVSKNHKNLSTFIVENLSEKIDKSRPDISEGYKNILIYEISNICYNVLSNDTKFFGGEEIYEINKILKTQNLQFSKFFCRVELAIAISENVCNSLATNSSYIEQMMIAFKDIFGAEIDDLI
jgi:predicted unusual protein kinase regulating ubiquinone biosynthesis (AarF/ABC1/UbiB family)